MLKYKLIVLLLWKTTKEKKYLKKEKQRGEVHIAETTAFNKLEVSKGI